MSLIGLKLGFIYPDSVGNFHPMSTFNFLSLPKKPFHSLSLPNVIALLSVWTLDPLPTCIEISRDNTGWVWLTLVLVYSDRIWQAGTTTHSLPLFLVQCYTCPGFPTMLWKTCWQSSRGWGRVQAQLVFLPSRGSVQAYWASISRDLTATASSKCSPAVLETLWWLSFGDLA